MTGTIKELGRDHRTGLIIEDNTNRIYQIKFDSIPRRERRHIRLGSRVKFDGQIRLAGFVAYEIKAA
jgi:hypothetical protein